ncbi:ABC transporter ATP-binding protein [Sulfurimonas sp.]
MIKLRNVYKSFANAEVLKDISLDIKEGECIVFNGVSGSGKSTLLSIIGALLKPSRGLVKVDGLNIASLNDYHLSNYRGENLGFITQSFHLFEMLSVRENVVVPLLLSKLNQNEIENRVNEAMQISSINHKSQDEINTLSGGEKQRCVIARALVNNPKIILCDEPTANLDKENSLKFAQIIKTLKNSGKTIVIATHDPLISELEWVDRVIKIDEGKIE